MKTLFSLNSDGIVVVLPQAWLYAPFDDIRKKYKDSNLATIELGLIYFAADYRSRYLSIKEIEDRVNKIKKEVYGTRNIKIDSITYTAILFYTKAQNTTKIQLIKSVNNAIIKSINTIDTAEITDLKDIKELAEITAKLPAMIESLTALEKLIKKETELENDISGAGKKGIYEDE